MKNLVLYFVVLTLITTAACGDEPGGKSDICEGITCLNGGFCVNGDCDCPEGFSGPSCANEVTPLGITVKKVTVKNFPPTDPNGGGWDSNNGPDIYVEIERKKPDGTYMSVFSTEQSKIADADHTKNYAFSNNSISLKPDFSYRILLYDKDANNSEEEMDKKSFTAYTAGQKFPNPIVITGSKGTVFELQVDYNFPPQ